MQCGRAEPSSRRECLSDRPESAELKQRRDERPPLPIASFTKDRLATKVIATHLTPPVVAALLAADGLGVELCVLVEARADVRLRVVRVAAICPAGDGEGLDVVALLFDAVGHAQGIASGRRVLGQFWAGGGVCGCERGGEGECWRGGPL